MPRPKSNFLIEHGETIRRLYVDEEKSIGEIAEFLGVNTQRIFRAMQSLLIARRSKSESQKLALRSGRATHPTKNKTLSDENKKHLSESIAAAWANISPEERQRRSETSKAQYAKMSDKQKRILSYSASLAIRLAGKNGSKLEIWLNSQLTERGYQTIFHKKGAIINPDLEIDLLLPAQKIAIEVDGVFHSENIFGELGKVVHRDQEKNGLLLAAGYVVIRLENTSKSCSLHYKNKKIEQLMECITKIENEFPPLDSRLIYLTDEKL